MALTAAHPGLAAGSDRPSSVPVGRTTSRPRAWAAALGAVAVLVALVAVDVWLVQESLRVEASGQVAQYRQWLLTTDRGIPERWGYAQQGAAAGLLLLVAALRRRRLFVAWAAVFGMALLDDALRVHERLGVALAERWSLPEGVLGLRAQDLGELSVWGLLAVVPLLAAVVLHRRSDRRTRRAGRALAAVVCLYAVFGIGADQVHVLGAGGPHDALLTVLEDGGELVALSLAVAVALLLAVRSLTGAQAPERAAAAASSSPA